MLHVTYHEVAKDEWSSILASLERAGAGPRHGESRRRSSECHRGIKLEQALDMHDDLRLKAILQVSTQEVQMDTKPNAIHHE